MAGGAPRKVCESPKSKEPTKAVRSPISIINTIFNGKAGLKLPLYLSKVSAGFPSPAEDDMGEKLDLNDYLIKHPAATFFVRASGNSMINAGIYDNDILIVDRSITPTDGKIVIVAIDGQLTVKRLKKQANGVIRLLAENPHYKTIEIQEDNNLHIWGVVTNVIHEL